MLFIEVRTDEGDPVAGWEAREVPTMRAALDAASTAEFIGQFGSPPLTETAALARAGREGAYVDVEVDLLLPHRREASGYVLCIEGASE